MKQLKYFVIGTDGSIKFVSCYIYAQCVLLGGKNGAVDILELHWMNLTHKSVQSCVVFCGWFMWNSNGVMVCPDR